MSCYDVRCYDMSCYDVKDNCNVVSLNCNVEEGC